MLVALTGLAVVVAGMSSAAAGRGEPGKVRGLEVAGAFAIDDKARLVLRWDAVRRATRYEVRYAPHRSPGRARTVRTGKAAAVIRNLRPNTVYCFRVRAATKVRKRWRYGAPSAVRCRSTPRRVHPAGAVWISEQSIVQTSAGPRASLTLRWARPAGAAVHDLEYADALRIRDSPRRVRLRGIRAPGAVATATLRGLKPGTVYCFRVRGRTSAAIGHHGPRLCRVTMPSSRALKPTRFGLRVATYNVCGSCPYAPWSWPQRRSGVVGLIAGAGADVVGLQETHGRVGELADRLADRGFVRACATGALGNQAVFVRSSVYTVVLGSADSMLFPGDGRHGACWVRLRHRETGTHVVVATMHARTGRSMAHSRVRYRQAASVLAALERRFGEVGASGTPPFVFTGDFNSHRGHSLDGPRVALGRAGFHDAYDVAAAFTAPFRGSANAFRRVPKPRRNNWGGHIDRIFVPAGATATGWRTVARMSRGRYAAPMPSDHNPVVVTVYLAEEGGLLGGLGG